MLECDEHDKIFVGDTILAEFWNCRDCGICCRTFEELPMYIDEAKQIATNLGISYKTFKDTFTDKNHNKKDEISLKSPCPFLKHNSCSIYSIRGFICRTFPLSINLSTNQAVLSGIYFCPQATQFYEGLIDFLYNTNLTIYHKLIQKEKKLFIDDLGMKIQGTADIFTAYLDWIYNNNK